MKYLKLLLPIILILIISTPALAAPSFLTSDESGAISIASPIGDDAYIAGGNVVINKDIAGDLFVAGGRIDINANIAGDLFISGGDISVRGSVGDDLRIGGGNVNIYGKIGDDLMIGGGTVLIADTSVINGDLLVGAGDFNLYGKVLGNAKAGFGNGHMEGIISGDADFRFGDGQLSFSDNAQIGGTLDYWAAKESNSFGSLSNSINYHKMLTGSKNLPKFAAIFAPLAIFAGVLWIFISILVLGGLILLLLPKYLPRLVETVKKDYWMALWQGVLFLIVVPVLSLLIALTGFGITVSTIMMLSYLVVIILASIPVSMAVGSYILSYKDGQKGRQFIALAIGVFIYLALGTLPFIGWVLKFALFAMGVGVLWLDSRSLIKKGDY